MPMVMITGQKGIMSSRQARFQIVDMVATMRPLTKSTRQIVSTAIHLRARRVPGSDGGAARPVHLELPEDIAGEEARTFLGATAPDRAADRTAGGARSCGRNDLNAKHPLVMLGAASSRPRLTAGLTEFIRRTQIPFFNTQMGKGTVAGGHNLYMGTAALSERDYVHGRSTGRT